MALTSTMRVTFIESQWSSLKASTKQVATRHAESQCSHHFCPKMLSFNFPPNHNSLQFCCARVFAWISDQIQPAFKWNLRSYTYHTNTHIIHTHMCLCVHKKHYYSFWHSVTLNCTKCAFTLVPLIPIDPLLLHIDNNRKQIKCAQKNMHQICADIILLDTQLTWGSNNNLLVNSNKSSAQLNKFSISLIAFDDTAVNVCCCDAVLNVHNINIILVSIK